MKKDLNRINQINPETDREGKIKKFLVFILMHEKFLDEADKDANDDLLSFIECSIKDIGYNYIGYKCLGDKEDQALFTRSTDLPLTNPHNQNDITYNEALGFLNKYNLMPA